ncbi:hypothetical protein M8818_003801 [Zalaria obscura]|uniref:Uncharacterized protein n=1 Tax=Zalaria obscura TaxID=2024903 RepID=A0ACC3SEE3_9PEZI
MSRPFWTRTVSQRYLDLTREKLQLARLPREPYGLSRIEELGVKKAELEPLLDYWLETYDCRAQEQLYNDKLPQYRISIPPPRHTQVSSEVQQDNLRLHFVHRRSTFPNAIPLLICHDWGGSFLEAARVIEALCEPVSTPPLGQLDVPAFHFICPSIPGFGFSDTSPDPEFGLEKTAEVFHQLMLKLGYDRYMIYGSGWGFNIARAISLRHKSSILGIHAVNVETPFPSFRQYPFIWLKYHIARLTNARIQLLSFAYMPTDFASAAPHNSRPTIAQDNTMVPAASNAIAHPQTLSYALADSPTGLLAFLLDLIKPNDLHSGTVQPEDQPPSATFPPSTDSRSPTMPLERIRSDVWTSTDIITWTMLYWLPGPEAALRWLKNALRETRASDFWHSYSRVPLGITYFQPSTGAAISPPVWMSAYHNLTWLRRHDRQARWPCWEAGDEVVMDLRDFAREIRGHVTRDREG